MKQEPFILERTLNASAARIWEAITSKEKMKEWYFALDAFEPIVDFEFSFSGGSEQQQCLHLCKVTEVIPGKKLTYSWRYEVIPASHGLALNYSRRETRRGSGSLMKGWKVSRRVNRILQDKVSKLVGPTSSARASANTCRRSFNKKMENRCRLSIFYNAVNMFTENLLLQ
jgi:uncharacterized protein YndB with AHSA1/START domain